MTGDTARAVPAVYAAIAGVTADLALTGIGKDAHNKFDHYDYRSGDALYAGLAPLLPKHGLVMLPSILVREADERPSKDGSLLMSHVVVHIRFELIAVSDGSRHELIAIGEATDRGDKATAKAQTAAYKQFVTTLFSIPYTGTAEADQDSHDTSRAAPRRSRSISSSRVQSSSVGRPKPEATQRAHVPAHEVDELTARWADEIDAAASVVDLELVGQQMQSLPEAVRADLRRRYKERHEALAEVEKDRRDLDALEQA